jgi:Rrf2 family transcriptional regulator, nitric oxide-sensitive transcriptional repressor
MISQTAEYALRAVVTLAANPGRALTAQAIAAESRIPLDYLAKILNMLSRAGLVRARRGPGGGFQIEIPASQLSILEIVSAVDPLKRIKVCPLGLAAHGENLCSLHRSLDEAIRMVEDAFRATTVESLIGRAICKGGPCHEVAN